MIRKINYSISIQFQFRSDPYGCAWHRCKLSTRKNPPHWFPISIIRSHEKKNHPDCLRHANLFRFIISPSLCRLICFVRHCNFNILLKRRRKTKNSKAVNKWAESGCDRVVKCEIALQTYADKKAHTKKTVYSSRMDPCICNGKMSPWNGTNSNSLQMFICLTNAPKSIRIIHVSKQREREQKKCIQALCLSMCISKSMARLAFVCAFCFFSDFSI